MTAEREEFLRRVAAGDGAVRPPESEIQLMATLLRTHMLLGHLNGEDWYEVHPLARRVLGLPPHSEGQRDGEDLPGSG
jgi:hypothetical protein